MEEKYFTNAETFYMININTEQKITWDNKSVSGSCKGKGETFANCRARNTAEEAYKKGEIFVCGVEEK